MRKRLNKKQAEQLGFKVKPKNADGSNPKYNVTR